MTNTQTEAKIETKVTQDQLLSEILVPNTSATQFNQKAEQAIEAFLEQAESNRELAAVNLGKLGILLYKKGNYDLSMRALCYAKILGNKDEQVANDIAELKDSYQQRNGFGYYGYRRIFISSKEELDVLYYLSVAENDSSKLVRKFCTCYLYNSFPSPTHEDRLKLANLMVRDLSSKSTVVAQRANQILEAIKKQGLNSTTLDSIECYLGAKFNQSDTSDASALYNRGFCYENGIGVTTNYETAFGNYQSAREQGEIKSIKGMGRLYENGKGISKDPAKAIQCYQAAAELKDQDANWLLKYIAESLLTEKQYVLAAYAQRRASIFGNQQTYDTYSKLRQISRQGWHMSSDKNKEVLYETAMMEYTTYRDTNELFNLLAFNSDEATQVKFANLMIRDLTPSTSLVAQHTQKILTDIRSRFINNRALELVNHYFAAKFNETETKDAPALFYRGCCYNFGIGVESDFKQAFVNYQLAAKQEHAVAFNNIADLYVKGHGVEQNYAMALDSFHEAAERKFEPAINTGLPNIGHKLLEEKQYVLAARALLGAKIFGTNNTQIVTDFTTLRGLAKDLDPEQQLKVLYACAMADNNADALLELVKNNLDEGCQKMFFAFIYKDLTSKFTQMANHAQKIAQSLVRAEDNDLTFLLMLRAYFVGLEHQFKLPNETKDLSLFFNIAICYEYGLGIPKDEKQAVACYESAAKQEYPEALFRLGLCYDRGIGVEKNPLKAPSFYQQAAEFKHPAALYQLGLCYENGRGFDQDEEHALRLFQDAASYGYKAAITHLGEFGHSLLEEQEYFFAARVLRNAKILGNTNKQVSSDIANLPHMVANLEAETKLEVGYECMMANQDLSSLEQLLQTYSSADLQLRFAKLAIRDYQDNSTVFEQHATMILNQLIGRNNNFRALNLLASFSAAKLDEEKAANAAVFFHRGVCFQFGLSVEQDNKQAIDNYECAANLKYPQALHQLGVFYMQGSCVDKKDESKAIDYYQQAAELKHEDSINNLSILGYSLLEQKTYAVAARALCSFTIFESDQKVFADIAQLRNQTVDFAPQTGCEVLYYCMVAENNTDAMSQFLATTREVALLQEQFVNLAIKDLYSKTTTISKLVNVLLKTLVVTKRDLHIPALERLSAHFAIVTLRDSARADEKDKPEVKVTDEIKEALSYALNLLPEQLKATEGSELGIYIFNHLNLVADFLRPKEEMSVLKSKDFAIHYQQMALTLTLKYLVRAAGELPPPVIIGSNQKKKKTEVTGNKDEKEQSAPTVLQLTSSLDAEDIELEVKENSSEQDQQAAIEASRHLQMIYHIIKEKNGMPPQTVLYLRKGITADEVLEFIQEQENRKLGTAEDNIDKKLKLYLIRLRNPAPLPKLYAVSAKVEEEKKTDQETAKKDEKQVDLRVTALEEKKDDKQKDEQKVVSRDKDLKLLAVEYRAGCSELEQAQNNETQKIFNAKKHLMVAVEIARKLNLSEPDMKQYTAKVEECEERLRSETIGVRFNLRS